MDPAILASFEASAIESRHKRHGTRQMFLDVEVWRKIEGIADMAGRCYFGVSTLGTSAAQIRCSSSYWPDSGRLECIAAFPSEPGLEERGIRDGVVRLVQQVCPTW